MEGNKLELSGRPANDVASNYKTIPEIDIEEEAVSSRPKSLLKLKLGRDEPDGADEKMLPNSDEKVAPGSNINIADVKISPSEKQNGDAKLDIGDVKSAFVGLTKEELMKYANDPFWIRLRWFLFITFWALWVAMLVGAIMIIYAAPKCDPPPPKTWWEQGPLSEVNTLSSLEELKSLKEKGVQGFIVKWPGDSYNTNLNDSNDLIKLLRQAKEQELNVIVELKPGTSSMWFDQSANREIPFNDYYIWKEAKTNTTGDPQPPNNWLNPQSVSSWVYSTRRKEFYYAPTGKPHLNLRNPNVTELFGNVIKKFIEFGAAGIRLSGVANLLVDPKFKSEALKPHNPGVLHTDYAFYTHTKTENLPELGALLKLWRTVVKTSTDNGPFMIAEDLTNADAYKVNGSLIIDLPVQSHLFNKNDFNVTEISKGLDRIFNSDNINWPLWNYRASGILDCIVFLLPGAPLIEQDATINSDLLKIRNMPSIMRGTFSWHEINNKTVFAFIRVTSGNPGILVALNPTDNRVVVDFPREIPAVSEEVTVQLFSTNYNETNVDINVKQGAHMVPLSPKSAIILSYVPKAS